MLLIENTTHCSNPNSKNCSPTNLANNVTKINYDNLNNSNKCLKQEVDEKMDSEDMKFSEELDYGVNPVTASPSNNNFNTYNNYPEMMVKESSTEEMFDNTHLFNFEDYFTV